MRSRSDDSRDAIYRDGRVLIAGNVDWPDGTRIVVTPVSPLEDNGQLDGHVIIVGFGLAGRCIADLLELAKLPFTIVERNPVTVETQRALGRNIIHGDATRAEILAEAGLATGAILALTIPDEEAVLAATSLARRLCPDIHIIARTNYSSMGMKASQLGADEVIKAEQAVAMQFYDRFKRRIRQLSSHEK